MSFSLTSTIAQVLNKTRTYQRFSDAAADVVNARIYEGIHFRFADVVAHTQGTHVANWAFARFLRPLGTPTGLYQLVASHSQKCLDVPAWSLNDGMPIVQWACNGGDNQTWSVQDRRRTATRASSHGTAASAWTSAASQRAMAPRSFSGSVMAAIINSGESSCHGRLSTRGPPQRQVPGRQRRI